MRASTTTDRSLPNRLAARIIVVDGSDRVLLFRHQRASDKPSAWITPGGGVEPGERLSLTAVRELFEETGIRVTEAELGEPVATTSGIWRPGHQKYEHSAYQTVHWFFFVRTNTTDIDTSGLEKHEVEALRTHRWWRMEDLESTRETVYPLGLSSVLRDLLTGARPQEPIILPWRP